MDFFLTNIWLAWLVVSIVCLIVELSSGDLYFICFDIGAVVAMVAALLGLPFWAQVIVFAVASVLCLVFLRPSLLRRLHDKKERQSNADALVGQQGTVIMAIPADGYGYVKIAGDEWRSVSASGLPIDEGTRVIVVSRESTILSVAP